MVKTSRRAPAVHFEFEWCMTRYGLSASRVSTPFHRLPPVPVCPPRLTMVVTRLHRRVDTGDDVDACLSSMSGRMLLTRTRKTRRTMGKSTLREGALDVAGFFCSRFVL